MMPAIATAGVWLGERLAAGSVQAIVLVALAWLACRRRVRLSPAMQAALWWAVLLKVVLVFAPLPSLSIPILPAGVAASPAAVQSHGVDVAALPLPAAHAATREDGELWILLAVGVWLAGVGWHASLMLRALRTTRAMVRRSSPSSEDDGLVGGLAASLGLSAVPAVRIAEDATAPLVVGAWRPTVLMPGADTLSLPERRMALGHEFMHITHLDRSGS